MVLDLHEFKQQILGILDLDPLQTDNTADLLRLFPNGALCILLKIMGQRTTWSLFPGHGTTAAHVAPDGADLHPYIREIGGAS